MSHVSMSIAREEFETSLPATQSEPSVTRQAAATSKSARR